MDNQDIRTLKILEEIDNDHVPSQRDIAKKLNVSLGLVNSFIKRLAQKGYFKITTIPKNRVRYILTPKGAAEKVRLTYEYIHYSVQYYKDTRNKLRNLFEDLTHQGVKRVAFFGVSDLTEIAYISLYESKLKLVTIVDEDKSAKHILNTLVLHPSSLSSLSYDKLIVTAMKYDDRLKQKIVSFGVPYDKILHI